MRITFGRFDLIRAFVTFQYSPIAAHSQQENEHFRGLDECAETGCWTGLYKPESWMIGFEWVDGRAVVTLRCTQYKSKGASKYYVIKILEI